MAISNAKAANMPNANVERAIKRGTGEIEGASYEQLTYEGYGQNGVAIFVETLTDNKLRTVAEVRHIFSKYGGNLAENGAVAWMFEQKGRIEIPLEGQDEDEFMMTALEAGADDVAFEEDIIEVLTPYTELHNVVKELEDGGFNITNAELTRIPKNTVNADDVAEKLLNLIEKLEDCDDVQKVYANFDISDDVLDRISDS